MIEVLKLPKGDVFDVSEEIATTKCFVDFYEAMKKEEDPKLRTPIRETIFYVILLYSKDSFLNKKPIETLQQRIFKAAKLAELDTDDEAIQSLVFNLESELVRNLVVDFLIYQNESKWSNRCAIEAQMAENLRIRMKPIEKEKADKDILNKHLLTEHYTDYEDQIKKLDAEIFLDYNPKLKDSARAKTTLESLLQ